MIDENIYEINENGLKVGSQREILDYYKQKLSEIPGLQNINWDDQAPDTNLINIITQTQTDTSEILSYIYSQLNIRTAVGVNLDNLVALNGIRRNGGSFTELLITVKINRNVSLSGLDDQINNEQGTGFTIADNSGNKYILEKSVDLEFDPEGEEVQSFDLLFRSQVKGNITPILQSIVNINTPQLGVIEVSNDSAPVNIGQEQESDYELRNRFFNTFYTKGKGSYESIVSAVYNVDGVTSVNGENNTASYTSPYGTPSHSIWLIIEGGTEKDIADAIYSQINTGCGIRGEIEYIYQDEFDNPYYIRFDRPSYENLYVRFKIQKKDSSYIYNEEYIKEQLVGKLQFKIDQKIDTTLITSILQEIDNNLVYYDLTISNDNSTWVELLSNTSKNYCWSLNVNNINIGEF